MLHMDWEDYADRVYGCWLGKAIGGTLGAPFEQAVGGRQPARDIDWYANDVLTPGGAPNDDLDLQLVWLHALETRGVFLTSHDLAQEWLDHVGMDPDEYAIAKGNLRKGLPPPLSGSYDNWFQDSMGCPIRSEIWACIAPGRPDIAIRYAQMDGCVDHGAGESVFGEMFNAAVQSAAFFLKDREELLRIGLSAIPDSCRTSQAIRTVLRAHEEGVSWQSLREQLIEGYGSFNAQYSPINEAFIVLGWLYGTDFGNAICTAVGCGYDTDCTGATLGALLGILLGRKGLPSRWVEPIGSTITTTASWGGITGFDIPGDVGELTNRVERVARQVLALHDDAEGRVVQPSATQLNQLWSKSGNVVEYGIGPIKIATEYEHGPAVAAGVPVPLVCCVTNTGDTTLRATLSLEAPKGWHVQPEMLDVELPPNTPVRSRFTLVAPPSGPVLIHTSECAHWHLHVRQRPATAAVPVPLVGARRWLVAGPFPNHSGQGFDAPHGPEINPDRHAHWQVGESALRWQERSFSGQFLALNDLFGPVGSGVVYAQTFLWAPSTRQIRFTAPCTDGIKAWINDTQVLADHTHGPIRPFPTPYQDHPELRGENAVVTVNAGWNRVLLKVTRCEGSHLEVACSWAELQMPTMTPDLENTYFPWEV